MSAIEALGSPPLGFEAPTVWLLCLLLSTIRIQAALFIIPLFNKAIVPGLVRAAIGVSLGSMQVVPLHAAIGAAMPGTVELVAIVLKEGLLGVLLGYGFAVLFWAVEAIGFLVDNQRGASIASSLNPLTGNDTSPLGIMFNQAFIVFFMIAGGFFVLLGVLYDSFRIWPPHSFVPGLGAAGIDVFAGLFDKVLRLSLLLSAPAIVAMLLSELGLALVCRFAPQLQVFFLAMPIKSGLAFLVLVIYLPTLFSYLHDEVALLRNLPAQLERAVR